MKYCLLFAVLLFSQLAFGETPWTTSRLQTIPAPTAVNGVQQIPLQLVIDEGSPWAAAGEMQRQIDLTRESLGPCGIDLGQIELRFVRYSDAVVNAITNASPYNPPAELALTEGDQTSTRPLVWLFNRQIPSTAKAYTRSAIDSLSRTSTVSLDPILHTSVITASHMLGDPKLGAAPSYTNLAHELAHILGNLDHVDERNNLMSDDRSANAKTGRLNPEQCAQIREYCLVNFSQVRESARSLETGTFLNAPATCSGE